MSAMTKIATTEDFVFQLVEFYTENIFEKVAVDDDDTSDIDISEDEEDISDTSDIDISEDEDDDNFDWKLDFVRKSNHVPTVRRSRMDMSVLSQRGGSNRSHFLLLLKSHFVPLCEMLYKVTVTAIKKND